MTYRETAINIVKIAGQELIDKAEKLIPQGSGFQKIEINARIPIPTMTDDPDCLPEINIETKKYIDREAFETIYTLLQKYDDDEEEENEK